MIVTVPKETVPGERRVALVPDLVPKLIRAGLEVVVQSGAGTAAGFPDASYQEQGARLGSEPFDGADIVLKVQSPTGEEIVQIKEGATLIGFLQPYSNAAGLRLVRRPGVDPHKAAGLCPGTLVLLGNNPSCHQAMDTENTKGESTPPATISFSPARSGASSVRK